ncbi:unnamed protein product [Bursaphelenchus xylophilus]|uniref:(pine wood nematode) hypothetical protein n=1 Tax=Bursaphelenchus xylophilus TaxID=6326 RepID=A0A7I8XIQ2_BURXY|nr:unnamed protein product [Bursaphelenchus xylophilus]CAG9125225.1 unnamed protein product [Bursaphelenchus xylophilus]
MGDIGRLRQNVNVNKNAYGGKVCVVYSESLDFENEGPQKAKTIFKPNDKVITEQPVNRYWDNILVPNGKNKKVKDPANGGKDPHKEFVEKAVADEKPDLSEDRGYYCCT